MEYLILFFLIVFLFILLVFLIIFLFFFLSIFIFNNPPYVPTKVRVLKEVRDFLEEINFPKGAKIADLGSGDGRVIIYLGQQGYRAYGYEINPFLYWYTKIKIKLLKLEDRVFVFLGDFFKQDYSDFDLIFLYLYPQQMRKLEEKFLEELKPGTLVISNLFSFCRWKPLKITKVLKIYKKE